MELARLFKTRDSDTIIDALGTLLAAQTRRLEVGLENEEMDGELNSEVTKIVNTLFDRGVKLAKLVNPALGAKINANFNVNGGAVNAADMRGVTAQAVAALEAKGVPRSKITPDMIVSMLAPEPIDAEVVEEVASEAS